MSDLISRLELKHDISCDIAIEPETKEYLLRMIDGMETAYDVDKVVEQLEDAKCVDMHGEYPRIITIEAAIEIVKGAVKDE